MFVIDLERPDTGCIVDGRILEPPDLLAALTDKGEELNVHLDVMPGNLLVVALGVDFAHARSARQPANAIAAQNARYASVGYCDAVITRQVPDGPDRPDVIFATQVKDFVDDLGQRLVGRVLRNGLGVDQPGFAALVVSGLPAVEACTSHAKVSAGLGHMASLLGMAQHLELTLNVAVFLGHRVHPLCCLSAL